MLTINLRIAQLICAWDTHKNAMEVHRNLCNRATAFSAVRYHGLQVAEHQNRANECASAIARLRGRTPL